jgi:hypothetical protein
MFSNIAQVLYAEAFQSAFQHDGSLLAKGAAANEACAFDVDLSGRQWGDGYTWLHESCRLKMIHAGTKNRRKWRFFWVSGTCWCMWKHLSGAPRGQLSGFGIRLHLVAIYRNSLVCKGFTGFCFDTYGRIVAMT